MGEAKRRMAEIAKIKEFRNAWYSNLTAAEKLIADVAVRLEERLVRGRHYSEGCYHLAFFMTKYLGSKGVSVTPIVGWVNDGTWKGMTSHAWIEHNGKKTDLSLSCTSYPDAQPTGAFLVHDFVVRYGKANYSYHKDEDAAVATAHIWMRNDPDLKQVLDYKDAEHAAMVAFVSENRLDEYLSDAPAGVKYADLVRAVESSP